MSVKKEQCPLSEDPLLTKEGYKSVVMEYGVLCAVPIGTAWTVLWCAVSWDTVTLVCMQHLHICTGGDKIIISAGVISYSYYARFGQLFGPIWLYNLNCSGEERGIFNCSVFNFTSSDLCGHYNDPGVTCPGIEPFGIFMLLYVTFNLFNDSTLTSRQLH